MSDVVQFDLVVIGAGPAGLALVKSLADAPLRIALIEAQAQSVLENPPEDGRDIALTHTSEKIMGDLGMWAHIPEDQIGTIRDAKVLNGKSPFALHFDTKGQEGGYLGRIVPNFMIRKAAFAVMRDQANVTLISEQRVVGVETGATLSQVELADGRRLHAQLVIAADSRFSETRRMAGIAADSLDFGRVVIVCEMTHTLPHDDTAYECFQYDQTLAILPMAGLKSSVVVTLPASRAKQVMAMSDAAFAADIEKRFGRKLGVMTLVGSRYPYPLVGVLAKTFVGERFALIGDAAVGMHPVTAHGYNLGLSGAALLAQELRDAAAQGADIGARAGLKRYEAAHRRVVLPLYHGTNMLVKLFTDTSPPARILRGAALRLGDMLPPVKNRILHQLTHIE